MSVGDGPRTGDETRQVAQDAPFLPDASTASGPEDAERVRTPGSDSRPVSGDLRAEPLCVLDESNDMEAFAALPECVLCGGTGKQIPDGFWGIEAISDAMAERVGYAVRDALTATSAQDFDSPAAAWSAVGRAAVRALREAGE